MPPQVNEIRQPKKGLTWSLLYYSQQSRLKKKTSLMLALPQESLKIAF